MSHEVTNNEVSHEVNHEVTYEVNHVVIHEKSRNHSCTNITTSTIQPTLLLFEHSVTIRLQHTTHHILRL